jgi:polyisoprenoid-binding protein YceI
MATASQTRQLVRIVDGNLVPVPGTWEFDPGHTEVGFEARHLVVTRVRGRFNKFTGRLVVAPDPKDSVAELSIDAASVDSGFKDRDDHLRSADWFDVERHPAIRFRSGRLSHIAGNHWKAEGELTVKGITRSVALDVEFSGAVTDPWGNSKIGATITGQVDRHEFDLTWNMPLEAGGVVAARTVLLTVNVEAVLRA